MSYLLLKVNGEKIPKIKGEKKSKIKGFFFNFFVLLNLKSMTIILDFLSKN